MVGTERRIDAVVLDWGGVLTVPVPHFIDDWLHRENIDREHYGTTIRAWMGRDAAPDNPVAALETGALPVAEFERLLAAELRSLDGAAIAPAALLDRMFGTAGTDPTMVDLVRDLRRRGVRTALLSNSWGERYPEDLLPELFDALVISGRVGLRKPDPRIYTHTLDVLGLPAHRCVFVDDVQANVEGARAAGLHAHRHTDAESTRAVLTALLGAAA